MTAEVRRAQAGDRAALARLLVEVVEAGASLSFVAPLLLADAERFWAQTHPLATSGRASARPLGA